MPDFPPDPGGVFPSDVHRRVAANLPLPGEEPLGLEALLGQLHADVYTPISQQERDTLEQVLAELAELGFAKELTTGWRQLKAGLEALSGPALTETYFEGEDRKRREPVPLEGAKLEEAEAQQARIAEEDAAAIEAAKEEAV